MNDNQPVVLLVDDDDVFRRTASRALQRRGFEVADAASGEDALQSTALARCSAAVIDLRMPGMDGMELLSRLSRKAPGLPVILLTGHGDLSTAIEAIKEGAFHYMTKPCDIQELEIYLNKAVQQSEMRRENVHLRDVIQRAGDHHGIVGSSPAIRHMIELIDRLKDAEAPVLVLGETGSGKELVARALHYQSKRRERPFVDINCATLKPELLENELFGHVSGAFTGAVGQKEGLLAVADKGSLFIDEIADMDPNVQASLLRVIETGEFRPLGSTQVRKTRTRIIAAANRDLSAEAAAGRFRDDLFYRLNVLAIVAPPLRARKEDIPELVDAFLAKAPAGARGASFSPEALDVLQRYDWPGNVRELFNVCERAVLLSPGPLVDAEAVTRLLSASQTFAPASSSPLSTTGQPRTLEEAESDHIRTTLDHVGGNVSRAADILNIDRRTLQRKMKRYGLRGE